MCKVYLPLLLLGLLALAAPAHADDYVLSLKDHQFSPRELTLPAGQKVKLRIRNLDPTPAEFESTDLNREKIIPGNSETIIFIGPVEAGTYHYFDDFRRDTTTGSIIVK
jgi:hypothetical protein